MDNLPSLRNRIYLNRLRPTKNLVWDIHAISELDSAAIALWQLYRRKFEHEGITSQLIGITEEHSKLYTLLYSKHNEPRLNPNRPSWLYRLGEGAHKNLQGIGAFIAFLGEAFSLLFYTLLHPSKIRYRSIVSHIFTTGAQALPIIAISAFLIGVVIAYQSIVQLQKFGADIFIVDTIGISLTRELAPSSPLSSSLGGAVQRLRRKSVR
jgi:phospholipid/cholesterol/gamma-HCH transport system permease protein